MRETETDAPPKERGIVCSADEVRGLMAGTVTELRRVATKDASTTRIFWADDLPMEPGPDTYAGWVKECGAPLLISMRCPFGQPGDRLWTKETFFDHGDLPGVTVPLDARIEYRAEAWDRLCDPEGAGPWTPSTRMPRWASRVTLEIVSVTVEQVGSVWFWVLVVRGV